MNKLLQGFLSFAGAITLYLVAFLITLAFIAVVETLIKAFSTHAQ